MTCIFRIVVLFFATILASAVMAENNAYTNHAGNVVCGNVVSLTKSNVTFTNTIEGIEFSVPLSIFPKSEQRRISVDGGQVLVPQRIKNIVAASKKQIERSQGRANMGLCSEEEAHTVKTNTYNSLNVFLQKSVEKGEITQKEKSILLKDLF